MDNNITQDSLMADYKVTLVDIKQKFIDRVIENIRSPPFETEGSANESILAYDSVIFSTFASSNCPLSWINSFGSTTGSDAR